MSCRIRKTGLQILKKIIMKNCGPYWKFTTCIRPPISNSYNVGKIVKMWLPTCFAWNHSTRPSQPEDVGNWSRQAAAVHWLCRSECGHCKQSWWAPPKHCAEHNVMAFHSFSEDITQTSQSQGQSSSLASYFGPIWGWPKNSYNLKRHFPIPKSFRG